MAGRARAVAGNPAKKRRRKLEQIVRASSSPQRLVLRPRIVLLAADGWRAGSLRELKGEHLAVWVVSARAFSAATASMGSSGVAR